jgi:hypothetical protein
LEASDVPVMLLILTLALQANIVTTIVRSDSSLLEEPRQAVARTETEWAQLWRQHAGAAPLPPVDFTSRTVVAVFLGTRPTAGFGVEITGTRQDGATLVVQWRERRPGPDRMTAQVLTTPAHLASIPAASGEIRFEKIEP